MKLSTSILATALLLTSSVSFSQTSFISLKSVTGNETPSLITSGSIKFNLIGIADGIVKVKMFNQPAGIYTIQLFDSNGKSVGLEQINHSDNNIETVDFGNKYQGGSYQVSVINPDNKKTTETIMLLM